MNPMNSVAIGLGAGLGLILLGLALLALRRPILAKLGVRNIPRRPTQSLLIVMGLTLSTTIFVAALSLGDTLNHSIQSHVIESYGPIDQTISPAFLRTVMDLANDVPEGGDPGNEEGDALVALFEGLAEGDPVSLIQLFSEGLPGISEARYRSLRQSAMEHPLIDGMAGAIFFPTIIRNTSTGQGEPLGFIFAVDESYETQFGLHDSAGLAVSVKDLRPGVGEVVTAGLSGALEVAGRELESLSAGTELTTMGVVQAGAAAVGGLAMVQGQTFSLQDLDIPLSALEDLGLDTALFQDLGIDRINLEELGLTPDVLEGLGIDPATSLTLPEISSELNVFELINLNTLVSDIDSTLNPLGLQLQQGDIYLSQLGALQLNAQPGDLLEVFIGPLPVPYRVRAIVRESGPLGAVLPVVMMDVEEAQKLLFMSERINAVLVSNLGDPISGVRHTSEVNQLLRAWSLNERHFAAVMEQLSEPEVAEVIHRAAANNPSPVSVDVPEEAPTLIQDFFLSFSGAEDFAQHVALLDGYLTQSSAGSEAGEALEISLDDVRVALGNSSVREWLLSLPIESEVRESLQLEFSQLEDYQVLTPLSKELVLRGLDIAGVAFGAVFSISGAFSILAGLLLIFLIFVMLAAERRRELGIARAIGMHRGHMVQMFVTEGVLYELVAALIGLGAGLAVAYGMIGFLGTLFGSISQRMQSQDFLFQLDWSVAPSSIVIAYCMGVLLTGVIISLSSWRVSRLPVVAAIRNLPDDVRSQSRNVWIQWLESVVGASLLFAGVFLLWDYRTQQTVMEIGVSLVLFAMALLVYQGVNLTGLFAVVRGWMQPRANSASASQGARPSGWGGTAALLIVCALSAGLVILFWDISRWTPVITVAGLVAAYGLGHLDVSAALRKQTVLTILGLGLVAAWAPALWQDSSALFANDANPALVMVHFVLGGALALIGAILTGMGFADVVARAFSFLGTGVGLLAPAVRLAIAYPLSQRFRTGTIMLLFAMVTLTVTVMTLIIKATESLSTLNIEQTAGFDIVLESGLLSVFDPITDLDAEGEVRSDFPAEAIAVTGSVSRLELTKMEARVEGQETPASPNQPEWRMEDDWPIWEYITGFSPGYLRQASEIYVSERNADYSFIQKAVGYESDAEIWRALAERDDVAVVTRYKVVYGRDLEPAADQAATSSMREIVYWDGADIFLDMSMTDAVLPDVKLTVGWESDGVLNERELTVIGVLQAETMLESGSVMVNKSVLDFLRGRAVLPERHYVKVREGEDAGGVARALEKSLLSGGLNAVLMSDLNVAVQAVLRGILQLFRGFFALGLVVGVAGLAVISCRTVVERRQQLGMMRAIGARTWTVVLMFVLESGFLALTGIVIGVVAGLALGHQMVGQFYEVAGELAFTTPWRDIAMVLALTLGSALLSTLLPAWQVSRVYPAEALRYE